MMRIDPRSATLVAGREYLDNVRTRGFWLSILLLPVLVTAAAAIPAILTDSEAAARYAVIDQSGWVANAVHARVVGDDVRAVLDVAMASDPARLPSPLDEIVPTLETEGDRAAFEQLCVELIVELERNATEIVAPQTLAERFAHWWTVDPDAVVAIDDDITLRRFRLQGGVGTDRDTLNGLLAAERLMGYFVIPEDPVASGEGAAYVTRKLTNPDLRRWYERLVTDVIRDRRLREENVDAEIASWIQTPVRFAPVRLTDEGAETEADITDTIAQWAPVAFVYLLWISVFATTQMLLTNTIEEKSNKLVEVLLSSVAPIDLMAGKILGIAATGLTIVATWLLVLIGVVLGLPKVLGATLTVDLTGLLDHPAYLVSFVMYYVLGYFFYAAILCGLGSLANNLKEAQNLMMPVQLCLLIPLLVMVPIGRDPTGGLAVALSWFPPFTPFVMMNRAAFPPHWLTYLGTTLLMIGCIYVALRVATRVFAMGILMTGKPPKLRQLVKLLRGRHHAA